MRHVFFGAMVETRSTHLARRRIGPQTASVLRSVLRPLFFARFCEFGVVSLMRSLLLELRLLLRPVPLVLPARPLPMLVVLLVALPDVPLGEEVPLDDVPATDAPPTAEPPGGRNCARAATSRTLDRAPRRLRNLRIVGYLERISRPRQPSRPTEPDRLVGQNIARYRRDQRGWCCRRVTSVV
jgi:hypothetical protein